MIDRLYRRIAMLFVLIGLALVIVIARFLVQGGAFHKLTAHTAGMCTALDLAGETVADIAVDPTTGIAYVATTGPGTRDPKTAVKRIDLNATPLAMTPALATAPHQLDPVAIAFSAEADGKRLYVVDRLEGDRYGVEGFDADGDGNWIHSATLRDTRFKLPGDIVAAPSGQFYVTNRSPGHNIIDEIGEMLLARGRSTLVEHDTDRSRPAVTDLPGADGIGLNAKGDTLYLAEILPRQIQVFQRDTFGGLEPGAIIKLPGAPHRLTVAADGSLWIAVDPAFHMQEQVPAKGAASLILHVIHPDADHPAVSEVYADSGAQFSNATVAAAYGKTLLIGSPVESRLLACTMTDDAGH